MQVIGYGLCGPGEAGRYMRETLEEFKRLCDVVIILCNNCDQAEIDLIKEYGFEYRTDRREWGAHQWRIKQDFIERDIKQLAKEGDILVCLDMDETIPKLTKEWLQKADLEAYHVFIADLWNDPEHYKPESCFWNVRIWKWNGETKFKAKPVHCGLAPEWAYYYHRHAPFVLLHKGLMAKEDRDRKIKRYKRYDPNAEHLDRVYYDMLKSDTAKPFDFEAISKQIEEEVASYKQTKPRMSTTQRKKERYAFVENPYGAVLDIPERHVAQTLKRPGFKLIGWNDENEQEQIETMFEDTEVDAPEDLEHPGDAGSYQRPQADEKAEIDKMNGESEDLTEVFEEDENLARGTDSSDHPKPDPNKAPEPKVEAPVSTPKSTTAKKASSKTAAKKTARK